MNQQVILLRAVAASLVVASLLASRAVAAEPVIDAISAQMPAFVRQHKVAGAVALLATRDRVLHLDATGLADIASQRPMTIDAVCDVASMGKPFTAVGILMLQEEGRLKLDDEAVKYLPELAQLKTPDGAPAHPSIRHLLTHTAGFPFGANVYVRGQPAAKNMPVPEMVTTKPLLSVPGTKYQYSSPGYMLLGVIIERISGKPLGDYFQERLFTPLGMSSTRFSTAPADASSVVTSYTAKPDNALEVFTPPQFQRGLPRVATGAGGEFSTVRDYLQFCRMLLNDGEFAGKRYLTPASVAEMTHAVPNAAGDGALKSIGYGLGLMVVRESTALAPELTPGTYGHFGAFGTAAWIDPHRGLIALLFVQRAGGNGEEIGGIGLDFTTLAFAAVPPPHPR